MKLSRSRILLILTAATATLSSMGMSPHAATEVILSNPRFAGLTRIVMNTNVPLTGLGTAQIRITRADGSVVQPADILGVDVSGNSVSIALGAHPFDRITSEGTMIATGSYGSFRASKAVEVAREGEPAANGYVIGTTSSLDEGWNSLRTDRDFINPQTGERGFYHVTDVTPDRSDSGKPVVWDNGRITMPAHRSKTMLALFVEFPDRLAANSPDPYKDPSPYLDFLKGAVEWFRLASYDQFRFSLASPQAEKRLGWIKMDKNATQYRSGANTVPMHDYIAEACQKAYDQWGVKADDYDLLLIMPPRGQSGLSNGPTYLHNKGNGKNRVMYVDKDKKPHYIDTAITAGNDLWRWGYRWAIHESGHTFGLPDLYSYAPTIKDVRIGSFFFCGGWDMMGHIAGQSTDFLAWHKWKLHWIRDDQVDVVTRSSAQPTTHNITPVETPGGTKMVVVRTGLATAYVAEFRTKLGINALDQRGKYTGVIIYRINANVGAPRGADYTAQIISKKYYSNPVVGGPKNLTGFWRPVDNTTDGYESEDGCWLPGDVFSDPATGVTIGVSSISHFDASNPSASSYTANDVATVSVTKTTDAQLTRIVVLSNAKLNSPTDLTFDTNIELQQRLSGNRVREDSLFHPRCLVITKSNGSAVPENKIVRIVVNPAGVQVTLAQGVFRNMKDAKRATVATRPFYHFGAGAPVAIK